VHATCIGQRSMPLYWPVAWVPHGTPGGAM
jgi:hypothetical protein